jgi:hypothetical protein
VFVKLGRKSVPRIKLWLSMKISKLLTKCGEMHWQENESHSTSEWKNLRPKQDLSHLIDILFIILICFIWNTQVSVFTYGQFRTHAISISVQRSISHVTNLPLSFSLSTSIYSPLCFHLLPFDINTLMILYSVSLNIVDWTNTVFHLGTAHNKKI